MKKKAKVKGKAKTSRKRSAVKDLSARKAGAVKGGLLPASPVQQKGINLDKQLPGLLLPAVHRIADGSV
jgi:hypothetical protein